MISRIYVVSNKRATKANSYLIDSKLSEDKLATLAQALTNPILENYFIDESPKMENFSAALDCSLYLLQIAKDDLNIDGLNPVQISKILRDKFRKRISPVPYLCCKK